LDQTIFELHAEVCKSLSSPKRLEILSILRDKEMSVGEIVELMQVSKANVSQHLAIMRKAGIVSSRRSGLNVYYRVSNGKVIKACNLMREVLLEHQERTSKMMRRLA
jgi:DNA-binding transcriptional ArsR family regulator